MRAKFLKVFQLPNIPSDNFNSCDSSWNIYGQDFYCHSSFVKEENISKGMGMAAIIIKSDWKRFTMASWAWTNCISVFFYFLLYATIFKMPIKVQTCSATQNDKLNLSFVKMARNGRKWQLGRVEVVRYHRRWSLHLLSSAPAML